MTNKLAITIITISAIFGLLLGLLSTHPDPQPQKKYSFTAEELCENMGYDSAYSYDSDQTKLDCMAWSGNRSDTEVNLNLVWKYVGENPEKFDDDYNVEWK